MLELDVSKLEQLRKFSEMEKKEDTARFIIPTTFKQHMCFQADEALTYLSIYDDGALVGFFMIRTENSESVELRRMVVFKKGIGVGQRSLYALEKYCETHLACKRIWLDVFSYNTRARHIYEKTGYEKFKTANYSQRTLIFMEKYI
ncbi:GNAT family N-acetyltransferase [Aliiglaciecola sp. M165]|uniref:GNAT family N-acetyltransferase n=1 Tax=Aliiglaciecola sp. M165 TaxID=2593649 RepID=UPI0011813AD0|nr:GNAT family N-acetyltransferase [Aliiglaciecola sp. M165]TRY31414.1 GNAT family N-acetyltransferase [Aliiglaciecola sp. M165]